MSRICLICKRHFSGGDLLRKLLWAVWRKKAVFFTIVLSIITFSVFILHHELDIPFGEPLRLYSTLLLKANEIASKSPFVNVAITVLIPLLFTLALRHLVI